MVVGLRFLFWVEGQSCGRASCQKLVYVPFALPKLVGIGCCPVSSTGFLRSNGAGVVQWGFIGRVGRLVRLSLW